MNLHSLLCKRVQQVSVSLTFVTMFRRHNSAVNYNNQIIPSSGPLVVTHEIVLLFKGLLVTRVVPSTYIFVVLLSVPLNGLAMVTFTCRIREKKPAVIYMSHLACVDLLFTLLLPLKIHYQLNASDWVFGEAACCLLNATYYGNMYCSILLIMCMSVDRLSTRKATFICTLVWLLALAGIVPLLTLRQTFITCIDLLEEDSSMMLNLSVFLIHPCIYFFLPLVIILVSYSTIIYVLCAKHDHSATSSSSSDNRKRDAIMATAVGFLLYHCVCIAMGSNGLDTYLAYLLAVCLGSSNVFLNPLLYYYGSSQYRQQIRSVIWGSKSSPLGGGVYSKLCLTKHHNQQTSLYAFNAV
uniref:G-protein coupled receptors family 1 profile domain-containing protein n=1 Tax=Sinocyclocheilus grahami TaxID=75366 RepID=A0A672PAL8_SINGR